MLMGGTTTYAANLRQEEASRALLGKRILNMPTLFFDDNATLWMPQEFFETLVEYEEDIMGEHYDTEPHLRELRQEQLHGAPRSGPPVDEDFAP